MADVLDQQNRSAQVEISQPDSQQRSEEPRPEFNWWLGQLSPEKRAALKKLHRLDMRWNCSMLLYPILWGVAAWTMATFETWPVFAVGYVVISVSIHALAIFMHEAIHGTLFRDKFLDRWAGFLLGVPALFSCMAYKVAHLVHHRYNRTEKDPDEFTNFTNSKQVHAGLFYVWSLVGMFIYIFHVPVTAWLRGKASERKAVIFEYALMGAIYAIALGVASQAGKLMWVVHLWLIPIVVATVFGNVRGWAEHTMTKAGDPLTQSRTVTSNRVVSFLMCNLNYHLEHHLCPGIPWYNLPKMHALLQPEYREAGSSIYRSYLRFLFDAMLIGVHGLAPKVRTES